MGAFGLVWYVSSIRGRPGCRLLIWLAQLCQRSTYWAKCSREENHEAFQHPGPFQENIPRIEAVEAFEARECEFWNARKDIWYNADYLQVISLSDIFISPLEDMYDIVTLSTPALTDQNLAVTSSPNS